MKFAKKEHEQSSVSVVKPSPYSGSHKSANAFNWIVAFIKPIVE